MYIRYEKIFSQSLKIKKEKISPSNSNITKPTSNINSIKQENTPIIKKQNNSIEPKSFQNEIIGVSNTFSQNQTPNNNLTFINPYFNEFKLKMQEMTEESHISSILNDLFQKSLTNPRFTKKMIDQIGYINFEDTDYFRFLLNFCEDDEDDFLRKLCKIFYFESIIDLRFLNKVNLSFSLDDGKTHFESLPEPISDTIERQLRSYDRKFKISDFLENILDQVIGSIKRGESFDHLLQFLASIPWLKQFYQYITPRFLITLLLSISSSSVLLRVQENISKIRALPLIYNDTRSFLKKNVKLPLVNHHMYFAIIESYSLLNLNIGSMAQIKGNYEKLLNKHFYTKFEDSPSQVFREGAVDVNFDHNSDSPRKMSFLSVYSQTKEISLLEKLEPLVNMVMIQISIFDLQKEENSEDLKLLGDIFRFLKSKRISSFLVVRDFKKSFTQAQNGESKIRDMFSHAVNLKILFIRERDLANNDFSEFNKKICHQINNHFSNIQETYDQTMKMSKSNFLQHIIQSNGLSNINPSLENPNTSSDYIDQKISKIITNKKNEKQKLVKCIQKTNEFSQKIAISVDNNNYNISFFFNKLFLEKRTKITELRKKQHILTERKRVENLEKEIEQINKKIQISESTNLIKKFYDLVMDEDYSILLFLLVKKLKKINNQVQEPLMQRLDDLKSRENMTTTENQKQELKREIEALHLSSLGSAVSLDVLFRNIFPYLQENNTWLGNPQRKAFKTRVIDMLLDGFCLELIDGENLEYNPKFFVDFIHEIGSSKVVTVGCMGPQSSGKSTLLNYMFGTLFATSQGRCTSGLYLSVQKVRNPTNAVDYLLIIDSEGLHSSERNDSEYDRKICSFLMNNVDLLLVNVKGEMKNTMKKDLEMTLFTSNSLRSFKKVPEIYFVFNQSNVNNEDTIRTLHSQVKGMNQSIQRGLQSSHNNMNPRDIQLFKLEDEYLRILGNAFETTLKDKDADKGQKKDYKIKSTNQIFGQQTSELAKTIIQFVMKIEVGTAKNNFNQFFVKSLQGWKMIEKYTDLTCVADIEMLNKRISIDVICQEKFKVFKSEFTQLIKDTLKETETFISGYDQAFRLNRDLQEFENQKIEILQKELEKWKNSLKLDLERNRFGPKLIGEFIDRFAKDLELQFIGFKLDVNSLKNLQIIDLYKKTGPERIIAEAIRLKGRPDFASLSDDQKKVKVLEEYQIVFENFLESFTNDSNIYTMEEYMYRIIIDMAKNLHKLLPTNRLAYKIKEVNIQNCKNELNQKLRKGEMIRVSEQKLRNLETDFNIRIGSSSEKYLKYKELVRNSEALPETETDIGQMVSIFKDPCKCENQSRVFRAMENMTILSFDTGALVERIKNICYWMVFNQEDTGRELRNIDLANVSDISAELLRRVLKQELQIVYQEINAELELACAEIYDPMEGFLIYLAVLFLWKFIVESLRLKFERKYSSLATRKEEYRQFFVNTALDNQEEKALDALRVNMIRVIGNTIKKINANLKIKAKKELESTTVKNQYNSAEINKKMTKKYFKNTKSSMFEDTFAYMQNPLQKWDEYINNTLNKKYFAGIIEQSEKSRKEELEKKTERSLIVLDLLEEKFSNYINEGNNSIMSCFKVFTDLTKNTEINNYVEKNRFKDQITEHAFDILLKILKNENPLASKEVSVSGHIIEFIIPQNILTDMNSDIYNHSRFLNYHGSATNRDLCPLLVDLMEMSKDQNQNKIDNFLALFESLRNLIESEPAKKLDADPITRIGLGLDILYQQYNMTAKGCVNMCKFCRKKCDHPTPMTPTEQHRHHANHTGHQPRIFSGGYVMLGNEKLASKICCDLVDKHREIIVNQTSQTWEQTLNTPEMKDWDINSGTSVHAFQPFLDAYEKMWRIHGDRICRRIGRGISNDQKTITQFIEDYNQNKSIVATHYVIAVDESGSMTSGNLFANAMDGVRKAVDYLRGAYEADKCFVSFMLFNTRVRVLNSAYPLDQLPGIYPNIQAGGTNFSPVFKQCIEQVNLLKSTVTRTRILFFTDGYADYPSSEIENLRRMINDELIDLKLFMMTADENANLSSASNVFYKIRDYLGNSNCTINSGVGGESVGKKFIEIFDLET